MRTVLSVIVIVLLLAMMWPQRQAAGADFTQVDTLKTLVAQNLNFIDSFKNKREELFNSNQTGGRTDEVKLLSSGVRQSIFALHLQFDRLSKRTDVAKSNLNTSQPEVLILEDEWTSQNTNTSRFLDSLNNTPLDHDGNVLVQFQINFDGRPVEGWRVNSVAVIYVPNSASDSDKTQRENQIDSECGKDSDRYVKSETVSRRPEINGKRKTIAIIEKQIPPGEAYFWVQHPDTCPPRGPISRYYPTNAASGGCVPVYDQSYEKCFHIDLSAPAEKPYKKSWLRIWPS